ncbi:MAG: DUF885 domain-containing protein [Nitriliruptorales bacterium]|nr:DUF885 domain-containing protein [Nitriliruptorales bacterium]
MDELDVYALCHRFVDDLAELRPVEATAMGVPGHDHRWGDRSPDGYDEVAHRWRQLLADIDALPPSEGPWDALARRVARDAGEVELERHEHLEHLRDLNHLASFADVVRGEFLDVMDLSTIEGWSSAASRLESFGDVLTGYGASLAEGRRQGVVPARRQVKSVVSQFRESIRSEGRLGGLSKEFRETGLSEPGLASRVDAATATACAALSEFADHLESEVLPAADPVDGVGRERYLIAARQHLGMHLDPEETYAWAWAHLDDLLRDARDAAGDIAPDRSLGEVIDLLKTDPDYAADSQENFQRAMQARQEQALSDLDGSHFDIPDPVRAIEVRLASPGLPPGAWYHPPSEDWSRPGTVWWSFGDRQHIPLYEEVSTAYHEGFPGHHLQVGIQVSLSDRLSRLHRRYYWTPGYGEGWALYAERLMAELGYLERPEYVLGQLTSSILRAVRVVVDIGAHLELPIPDDAPLHPGERWNYELGVEMLGTVAFLDQDYAESEMLRYLGWPGQAISYAVGERVILDLRSQLQERLGDDYDPKEFHRRVLGSGPVGLDLLRDLVLGEPDASP